jgi:putative membrane protein
MIIRRRLEPAPRVERNLDGSLVMSTLFAFLHHVAAFALVAAVAVELALIRQELTPAVARRLIATDAVLGASAVTVLVVGLLRVFYFEKGAAYYFSSHAFLMKLGAFIIAAAISVIVTIEFQSWRKALRAGQAPTPTARKIRTLRSILHWELIAIVIILLGAAMMARGGWR